MMGRRHIHFTAETIHVNRRGCNYLWYCAVAMSAMLGSRAAGQCFNLNSPYGINAHAPTGTNLTQLFDKLQAAGIGWVRIDFNWFVIEPSQDVFSWGIYDSIASAAAARNLRIFATISYSPQWATSGPVQTGVPDNAADWYDVCYRAAVRYPAIEHWGLWNEPNLTQFWAGTRQQYIDLILKNGADAIHAGNPNAKVCGPELAHLNSRQWFFWLRDAINQSAGKLDIVTHHIYDADGNSDVATKLNGTTIFGGNPNNWSSTFPPSVREVLVNTGWLGNPFWITETGWASDEVGETNQANYYNGLLTDWLTNQPGRTWIHKFFFYESQDDATAGVPKWGIIRADFSVKPAYSSYQNFITAHPATPPCPAGNPSPAGGATDVSRTVTLTWTAGAGAATHNVYFGPASPGTPQGNQAGTSFSPPQLLPFTTYYWRIDEVGPAGVTTGEVWSFTTARLRGDLDNDGDSDQTDFGLFQRCLSGSGIAAAPGCGPADLSGDGDVDEADAVAFTGCMNGSDQAPACP